jgi:hypothetical protein
VSKTISKIEGTCRNIQLPGGDVFGEFFLYFIFYCCIYIRLINLKGDIDYFSKGPKLSRTDRTQKRRSFRVNSILSFRHNDKHETQYVGQLISIKGHII